MVNFERDPELAQMSDQELQLALKYYWNRYNKSVAILNDFWAASTAFQQLKVIEIARDSINNSWESIKAISAEQRYRFLP